MTNLSNDNESPRSVSRYGETDAHGEAAMLLVESLIHGLIAQSIIRLEDAIDVVTVAIDAKIEIAADLGDSKTTMDKSLGLLSAIRGSLSIDVF